MVVVVLVLVEWQDEKRKQGKTIIWLLPPGLPHPVFHVSHFNMVNKKVSFMGPNYHCSNQVHTVATLKRLKGAQKESGCFKVVLKGTILHPSPEILGTTKV